MRGAPARSVRIVPSVRMRFNPTRESSNLFVPGLMAFVLTIISSLMTAISLTREKETGTMEALLVSPLRPWQIIVGKVAPYLVIGFVERHRRDRRSAARVPRAAARQPARCCSPKALLFILVSLSLGILISARTSSQRVAMMGALVGTMLPTMLLSGFIFPLESMPWPLRAISNVVPARWFVLGRAQHHAEGRRPRVSVARDAGAAGDGAALLLAGEHAVRFTSGWTVAMRRILFLARAEVLHVVRDRATLAQVLVVPIVQLLCCRTPRRSRSRDTPIYVVDLDRTSASRGLVTRFAASGHFEVVGQSASLDSANEALLRRRRDDGADDPARLRAVARADRRRAGRARRSTPRRDRRPASCSRTRRAS